MPMDPAIATRIVRAFLVRRLLKLRSRAVKKDMRAFFLRFFSLLGASGELSSGSCVRFFTLSSAAAEAAAIPAAFAAAAFPESVPASGKNGSVSSVIFPSLIRTILVAYSSASSGLCVTITTSRSLATSFSRSMTWTLVSLSSAPVGSSARRISGSLTRALAIATLCICPPESWLGFLRIWSPRPTFSSASIARALRSVRETPEIVRASSTLARTVWCGMRL